MLSGMCLGPGMAHCIRSLPYTVEFSSRRGPLHMQLAIWHTSIEAHSHDELHEEHIKSKGEEVTRRKGGKKKKKRRRGRSSTLLKSRDLTWQVGKNEHTFFE